VEGEGHGNDNGGRMSIYTAIIDKRDDNDALGLVLLLKTTGADYAHNRNNTTINHNNGGGQNVAEPGQRGKATTAAATATTESQAGGKDLMLSSEKEAIKLNQTCREEALH
jgi:hypothetical protein